MPEAREAVKSCRIKAGDDAVRGRSVSPKHVLLVDERGWRKWRGWMERDLDFCHVAPAYISAQRACRWRGTESMKPRAFFTPPALPANRRRPARRRLPLALAAQNWTPFFGGKAGGVFFCAWISGCGRRARFPRLRAAAGRHGDHIVYEGRQRTPDCGVWWKIAEIPG